MNRMILIALTLATAACSTADLGRRAMALPNPTVPFDCMERMNNGEECAAIVPRDDFAAHAQATMSPNSPLTRSLR